MDRNTFWTIIDECNWASKPDIDDVKITLMRKGAETVSQLDEEYSKALGELHKAAAAAGYDYCCDSWSDTTAHVVGLGREEFERCLADPKLLLQRMNSGDYRESFSYCIPYKGDFERYSVEFLRGMLAEFAAQYEAGIGRAPEADDDIRRLVSLITSDDPMTVEDEAKGLAESIAKRVREAVLKAAGGRVWCWEGGDVLTNKWAVWNILSDMHLAARIAA